MLVDDEIIRRRIIDPAPCGETYYSRPSRKNKGAAKAERPESVLPFGA